MTPEEWRQIEHWYHELRACEAEKRTSLLAGLDSAIRIEVESLLAVNSDTEGLLSLAADNAGSGEPGSGASASSLAGTYVGPYQITGLLGVGGMGAVYRAVRDDQFRKEVAVKVLKPGSENKLAIIRLRQERQILAGLEHPNIARLLDGGVTESGLPYLVMEYVVGTPLLPRCFSLPLRQRLELFRAVCGAVEHAHRKLVVHRDLKPGNILVTDDLTPKLLDFGIAKLLDARMSDQALTITGMRLMTPEYASPEQVLGQNVTVASDVYSLGAVLYELVTHEKAHQIEAHAPLALERAICEREPRRPSTFEPAVDADLEAVLMKALRKEPWLRYPSVEQFSEDLRRYLDGYPVAARGDTRRYRMGKFVRRNKLALGAAAMLVCGTAVGVIEINRQARRAENRFQQVRKLANVVLFDLHREIENLAGATKARELMVKTSLEYLDSLTLEERDDHALRLELATAYEKVADVQGSPSFSNLGRPEAAVSAYRRALTITEPIPPSVASLELQARCNSKIGEILKDNLGQSAEGQRYLGRAVEIADSIPQKTGNSGFRARALAYSTLGGLGAAALEDIDDTTRKRALELTQAWVASEKSPESRYWEVVARESYGDALRTLGDLSNALMHFQGALRLIETLTAEQPDNAIWERELVVVLGQLGYVVGHPLYPNLGDRRTAVGHFERALRVLEKLNKDSADVRAELDLSEATAELAAVVGELDSVRAERLYRRSLDMNAAALQRNSDDTTIPFFQAFNRAGFASLLWHLGRQPEALHQMEAALRIQESLLLKTPGDAQHLQATGRLLRSMASFEIETNRLPAAAAHLTRSRHTLEGLYLKNPRRLTLIRDLSSAYDAHGKLAEKRGDWTEAASWYGKATDLWDTWRKVGISSPFDQSLRASSAALASAAERRARAR